MTLAIKTLTFGTVSALLVGSFIPLQAEPAIRPGDRIAFVGNTFADQLRNHGYLETLLIQHTQDNPVSIRNLGWAGDMLTARDRPTNFPTEESTLQDHKTDLIIACFGTGESFEGIRGLDTFKEDLRAFLSSHQGKSYNGKSEVRLILVSPIASEKIDPFTPNLERRNQELRAYTLAMKEVAIENSIPFVDLFEATHSLMTEWDNGNFTTNGVHLDETGYWAVSRLIFEQLTESPSQPWSIRIDIDDLKNEAKGVKVSELLSENDNLTFSTKEQRPPTLSPPTNLPLPKQLSAKRDRLAFMNLAPGSYTLWSDGQEVATADHDSWAKGVVIDSSPAHQDAEKLRAAINDKNLQFIYSWKALNQVHIVGERSHSPSGRSLPQEVIEFHNLTHQKEKELPSLLSQRTRTWRLEPTSLPQRPLIP